MKYRITPSIKCAQAYTNTGKKLPYTITWHGIASSVRSAAPARAIAPCVA